MEADKNKQETGNSGGQTNTPPNFNGIDLNGLFGNSAVWEWLKPILSGAGAMTGTYFMWIKPMQEKMDALSSKISEQEKQIKGLEADIEDLENVLSKRSANRSVDTDEPLKGTKTDYFEVRNKSERSGNFRKRRNLNL